MLNSENIIDRVKEYFNIESDIDLSTKLGIKNTTISNWRTRNTIDFKLLFTKCEFVNLNWLISGKGEMLRSEGENTPCTLEYPISGIPIYDIDATCGPIVRDFVGEPIIGYINIPEVKHGAVIVRATGDSMLPAICNNDYVAIREVKDASTIVWGQIYLVILDEYRLLKYLRKHPDETKLILKSENSSKYDDIIISKSDIVKLYIVENIIALRTLL